MPVPASLTPGEQNAHKLHSRQHPTRERFDSAKLFSFNVVCTLTIAEVPAVHPEMLEDS